MSFTNDYADTERAVAYDQLGFAGTYLLAFRDLPDLLEAHVAGRRALDFGCGTGRTARWLAALGYDAVGVDVAAEMVAVARRRDPAGDYRVIGDGAFGDLPAGGFDLALAAFTFDNIPGRGHRARLLRGLRGLLAPAGRLVVIVSTPEIYTREWVTFTTRDYPENRRARCGDVVRIRTTDYDDPRPVEDILWPDADYRTLFAETGLRCLTHARPLATGEEGVAWVSETEVAPWSLYVLAAGRPAADGDPTAP